MAWATGLSVHDGKGGVFHCISRYRRVCVHACAFPCALFYFGPECDVHKRGRNEQSSWRLKYTRIYSAQSGHGPHVLRENPLSLGAAVGLRRYLGETTFAAQKG